MSMNLTCNKVDLWQTPTHITYMCMMTYQGVGDFKYNKDAVTALMMYIKWVRSLTDGCYSTEEEEKRHRDYCSLINSHIKDVEATFGMKNLEVSYI